MAFEDFVIGELIGAGSFGCVYKAEDTRQDRTVAVKLTRFLLDTDHDQDLFRRECQAAGRLSAHPNIVTTHESGITSDNRGYLVFEYFPDGNLAANLDRIGPVRWPQLLAWGMDLAEALAFAHGQGIWHRDIKPANVLLDGDWACLADFGEAKRLDGTMTQTGGGFTPVFAAPERVLSNDATPACDLYSLGVTLYYALTGELPYGLAADTAATVAATHARSAGVPVFPSVVLPDLVSEVLAKLLEPDPKNRISTAADLRDQLAGVENALGQRFVVRAQTEAVEARNQAEAARLLVRAVRVEAGALRVEAEAAREAAKAHAQAAAAAQAELESARAQLEDLRSQFDVSSAVGRASRAQGSGRHVIVIPISSNESRQAPNAKVVDQDLIPVASPAWASGPTPNVTDRKSTAGAGLALLLPLYYLFISFMVLAILLGVVLLLVGFVLDKAIPRRVNSDAGASLDEDVDAERGCELLAGPSVENDTLKIDATVRSADALNDSDWFG